MALAPLPGEWSLSGPEVPNWEAPCSFGALPAGCQQAPAGSTALSLSCAGFGGSALQPDALANACGRWQLLEGAVLPSPAQGWLQLQRAGEVVAGPFLVAGIAA